MLALLRKITRGLPYLGKEVRALVSDRTPCFIAVPRVVHLWRDAPCNARCIMCTYGFFKGEAYKQLSSSIFTDEMMPRALEQIHELCGRGTIVSYMGGEATTSRCLTQWIEQASRLGLDFRFTTNGYAISQEMARRFVAAGLFNLGISIESLDPKINETIRPHPNGTAQTLRCIEMLLHERERQKKHLSLNIKTVLTDINLESFPQIVRRFGKLEGVICTPQVFEPHADMPPATRQLLGIKDENRLKRLANEIRQMKRDGYTIHVTEQGLREMIQQCAQNREPNAATPNKSLREWPPRNPSAISAPTTCGSPTAWPNSALFTRRSAISSPTQIPPSSRCGTANWPGASAQPRAPAGTSAPSPASAGPRSRTRSRLS